MSERKRTCYCERVDRSELGNYFGLRTDYEELSEDEHLILQRTRDALARDLDNLETYERGEYTVVAMADIRALADKHGVHEVAVSFPKQVNRPSGLIDIPAECSFLQCEMFINSNYKTDFLLKINYFVDVLLPHIEDAKKRLNEKSSEPFEAN